MDNHIERQGSNIINGSSFIQNNHFGHNQQQQQQQGINCASPESNSVISNGTNSSILSANHQPQRSGRRPSSHTRKTSQKSTILNNNKIQVADVTPNSATLLPPPSVMQRSNYLKNSNVGTNISYKSSDSFTNNNIISSSSSPSSSSIIGNNNNSTGTDFRLPSKSNDVDSIIYEEKNWWQHQNNNLPKPRKPSKCPLFCVFYAEFDIIVGSKISFQCPHQFMDNDIRISTADIHRRLSQEFESRFPSSSPERQRQPQKVNSINLQKNESIKHPTTNDPKKNSDNNDSGFLSSKDFKNNPRQGRSSSSPSTVKSTTSQQATSLTNNDNVHVLDKHSTDNQRTQKRSEPHVGQNSMSIFDSTSDYIITGSELTDQIVSLSTHNMHILSRPTIINNTSRYERNSFLFSVGFVIRRVEDPMPFRPLLSKFASTLRAMEVESEFLSDSKKRGRIQSVLQGILFSLNSKSKECNLLLDDANAIHLKLFKPPKPISYPVLDHVVPVLLKPEWQLQMFDWDLTINWIVKYIDGLKYTSLISESSEVDLEMVRACLRVLKHHGVLTFVDIFSYSNIYESTPLASSMLAGNQNKLLQAAFDFISKGSINSQYNSTGSLLHNTIIDSSNLHGVNNLGTTPPTLSQHLLDVSNHRFLVASSTNSQVRQQSKSSLDMSSHRLNQVFTNTPFLHQLQAHLSRKHHHQQPFGSRNVSSEFTARSVSPSSSTLVEQHHHMSSQITNPQYQSPNADTSNNNNPSSTNAPQPISSPLLPSSFPPTKDIHSNMSNKIDNSSNNSKKYNNTSNSYSSREGNRPSSFKCQSNSTSSFENTFKREKNREMLKMALAQMFCECHRNATFGNILLSKLTESIQKNSHIPNNTSNHASKPNHGDKNIPEWEFSSKGDGEFVKKNEYDDNSGTRALKHDSTRKHKESLHNLSTIDWKVVFDYFDHPRFISFGVIHGLIKRVHEYPWAFGKHLNKKEKSYEIKKINKENRKIKSNKKVDNNESSNQSIGRLMNLNPSNLRKLALKIAESMDGTKCDDELCCIYHQPLDTLKELVKTYANKSIVSLYSTSKYS